VRRAALPARTASNCRLCRYDAIIEPLVRAPNPIREDFIAFLGHIGELADGLKVKQIKADIMAEISSREAEAANYQRIPLSAYILPAKEFLLQDPDWAAALADITRGVEPEHWRETVAKAQVFFKDKLPTEIFNDALKAIENRTKQLEGSVADAVAESQQEVAEVTLTLNAAFDDIPEGSQQREDFKKNVLMDIAQSLGMRLRRPVFSALTDARQAYPSTASKSPICCPAPSSSSSK
jgi:hypothetical protein